MIVRARRRMTGEVNKFTRGGSMGGVRVGEDEDEDGVGVGVGAGD